ncbi:MAG: glycosyltransferase family 2 protein [Eubacterium sp.]|nr:glycosyltransferase family 2 protein [Eubacterium sp.]
MQKEEKTITGDPAKEKTPDISIIIPVYNVEEYLEECLESVLRQGFVHTEVIMIDDGSTDSSGRIAEEYAARYPQMQVYHIENGGLGHARNLGATYASGKYLMFLDSDDLLTDRALERMFYMAEYDNSDMVICNVWRFDSQRRWSTFLLQRALYNLPRIAHISRNEGLVYDTISTNKLIRRSFFFENAFRFEENILYEDMLLACKMHHKANHVSVDQEVGYLWRERDGETRSITQNKTELRNLRDRIRVSKSIGCFLKEEGAREILMRAFYYKVLDIDLSIFINNCDLLDDAAMTEMLGLINSYIDESIDFEILRELPILQQAKYLYVREGDLKGLREVREFQKQHNTDLIVSEENNRLYTSVPFCDGRLKHIDSTEYLTRLAPSKYIDDIRMEPDRIEIDAHVYRRRINLLAPEDQKIEAWLCSEITGKRISLDVTARPIEKLTEQYGNVRDPLTGQTGNYNYDGAGFCLTVPLKEIAEDPDTTGRYVILLHFHNRFEEGEVLLSGAGGGLVRRCHRTGMDQDGVHVRLNFGFSDILQIQIDRDAPTLQKIQKTEKGLQLELDTEAEQIILMRNDNRPVGNCPGTENDCDRNTFFLPESCMQKGWQYYLYAKIAGTIYPVFGKTKGIQLLKTDQRSQNLSGRFSIAISGGKYFGVCDTTGDSTIRLMMDQQITIIKKKKRKKDRDIIVTALRGEASSSRVVDTELLTVNTETGEGSVLCKGKRTGFGRMTKYLFQGKFGNKEMKNQYPYGTIEPVVCYHDKDGGRIISRMYTVEDYK